MAANPWVGRTLGGRYRLEQLLGQGGMSSVYKAVDPNLRRVVAVKLIHPHLSNQPEFLRRFEEEAAAVAQLRHPNIIQVFDFNHDDDLYYMVLEYVSGETLQDHLRKLEENGQNMAFEDAIRYAASVCDAIEYAHRRGMVHRDIKPANIMLDTNDQAILMDFGIAKIVGGQQHTASGALVGTALYMSPEQIRGERVDGRSDIYSLGVTLFEMVTGRPPFEADSTMTLMMMHLNDSLPNIRQLRPDIPEGLAQIIEKALSKEAAKRYESAAEMAAVLRREAANLKLSGTATDLVQVYQPTVRQPISQRGFSTPASAPVVASASAASASAPPSSAVRTGESGQSKAPSGVSSPAFPLKNRRLALISGCATVLLAAICVTVSAGAILRGGWINSPASSPTSPFAATQTVVQQTRAALQLLQSQPTQEGIAATQAPIDATNTAEPELASPTPIPTAMLDASGLLTPTSPPSSPFVQIITATLDGKVFVVDYETSGYIPQMGSRHIHFFFDSNTSGPPEIPTNGAYVMYAGPSPFRDLTTDDVPPGAKRICASAATKDHQFIPNSGSCVPLPALPNPLPTQALGSTQKPPKEKNGPTY